MLFIVFDNYTQKLGPSQFYFWRRKKNACLLGKQQYACGECVSSLCLVADRDNLAKIGGSQVNSVNTSADCETSDKVSSVTQAL